MDAERTVYHTATMTVPVSRFQWPPPTVATDTFTVPASIAAGTGKVLIEAHSLDGRVLGGAIRPLTVPASPLAFSLLPPPPLEGDSTVPLSIELANASPSLPVEQGALTLTLATPDRSITPTAGAAFTLVPSSSRALTVPLELPPLRFGAYTLTVSTNDEYGSRRQETPWSSVPLSKGTLDRASYRARGTVHLDVRLVNPGPFVLPLTTTLSSPISPLLSLTLRPHEILTPTWDVPIPPDVTAGSHPLSLTLDLPDDDSPARRIAAVRVPPSQLALSSTVPPAVDAGHTIPVTIANVGGVDTTVDHDLRVVDARGRTVVSATGSGVPIWAGESLAVPLTLPDQLVSGHYTLRATATDEASGAEERLFDTFEVGGLEAALAVATDRPTYLTTDSMTFTADLTNGVRPLSGGKLTWRVTQPAGRYRAADPEVVAYTLDDADLTSDEIDDVAVDSDGNVWFATQPYWDGEGYVGGGVSVRLSSGQWLTYTTANSGLASDHVAAVALTPNGDAWFALAAGEGEPPGVSVRLADPSTGSGQRWMTYTTANSGLLLNGVNDVAADEQGNVWFASGTHWEEGGVSVRLAGGEWLTYTTANSGLSANQVNAVAVDGAGNAWFAGSPDETGVGGASVRLSDGEWLTYTAETSGLSNNYVHDVAAAPNGDVWFAHSESSHPISLLHGDGSWETLELGEEGVGTVDAVAVDREGNVWFGHYEGLSVLRADGGWQHFDYDDGLSSEDVNAIAVAPDGARWLATGSGEDQPGGATAIRGPLAVLSPWQPYVDPFIETGGIGSFAGVLATAADPAGNRWFLSAWQGEGYAVYLQRLSAGGDAWQTDWVPEWSWGAGGDLAVDGSGTVWLATTGDANGIWARHAGGSWDEYTRGSTEGGLVSNDVQAVTVDARDRVWFATVPEWGIEDSGGVSVLSGTRWIVHTTANSGLASDEVYDVAVDDAGNA
jgi:sugar lactone lactonase YvrE